MAVEVETRHGSTEAHSKGKDVSIKDGHLLVVDATNMNAQIVAVYAPGHWGQFHRQGLTTLGWFTSGWDPRWCSPGSPWCRIPSASTSTSPQAHDGTPLQRRACGG